MTRDDSERLIDAVAAWVSAHTDLRALAVVGSWARGTAGTASDLDLILLTASPDSWRAEAEWLTEINWNQAGFSVTGFADADYGGIWSRHVMLTPSAEVELSFGDPEWAVTNPVDAGTARVVADGFRVIVDRDGALGRLKAALASKARPAPAPSPSSGSRRPPR